MRCFLCRGSRFVKIGRINGKRIVRCKKDGLVLSQLPVPEKRSLYSKTYYHIPAHPMLFASYWPYFKQKLHTIRNTTGIKMPKILDVGCGWGESLEVMRRHRIDYLGIDTSRSAIRICKRKGLRVRQTTLQKIKTGNRRDAITMFQVIEHIENPLPVLRSAFRLLKKGGILLLTTPNHDSPLRRLFKNKWSVYHDTTHVAFYDEKTLRMVLRKAGFRTIEIKIDTWRFISLAHVVKRLHLMFPILNLPPWLVRRLSIPIPTDPWGDLIAIAKK